MEDARPHHEPAIVRRLRQGRDRHRRRHAVVRMAFVVMGTVLSLGGVALLVLPGPAFLVIPLGLAILSLEFEWAGRLLERSLAQAAIAREKARRTSTVQRVATVLAGACAAAAVVAWAVIGDIPLLPV